MTSLTSPSTEMTSQSPTPPPPLVKVTSINYTTEQEGAKAVVVSNGACNTTASMSPFLKGMITKPDSTCTVNQIPEAAAAAVAGGSGFNDMANRSSGGGGEDMQMPTSSSLTFNMSSSFRSSLGSRSGGAGSESGSRRGGEGTVIDLPTLKSPMAMEGSNPASVSQLNRLPTSMIHPAILVGPATGRQPSKPPSPAPLSLMSLEPLLGSEDLSTMPAPSSAKSAVESDTESGSLRMTCPPSQRPPSLGSNSGSDCVDSTLLTRFQQKESVGTGSAAGSSSSSPPPPLLPQEPPPVLALSTAEPTHQSSQELFLLSLAPASIQAKVQISSSVSSSISSRASSSCFEEIGKDEYERHRQSSQESTKAAVKKEQSNQPQMATSGRHGSGGGGGASVEDCIETLEVVEVKAAHKTFDRIKQFFSSGKSKLLQSGGYAKTRRYAFETEETSKKENLQNSTSKNDIKTGGTLNKAFVSDEIGEEHRLDESAYPTIAITGQPRRGLPKVSKESNGPGHDNPAYVNDESKKEEVKGGGHVYALTTVLQNDEGADLTTNDDVFLAPQNVAESPVKSESNREGNSHRDESCNGEEPEEDQTDDDDGFVTVCQHENLSVVHDQETSCNMLTAENIRKPGLQPKKSCLKETAVDGRLIFSSNVMKKRDLRRIKFETFEAEELLKRKEKKRQKCDKCKEYKQMKNKKRCYLIESALAFLLVFVIALSLYGMLHNKWMVDCMNANLNQVTVLGLAPKTPHDYGIKMAGDTPYLEAIITDQERRHVSLAVAGDQSVHVHPRYSLFASSFYGGNQLAMEVEIQHRVWCPVLGHARRRCSEHKTYVVAVPRDKLKQVWSSDWMAPSRAFCRHYLGKEHCIESACGFQKPHPDSTTVKYEDDVYPGDLNQDYNELY